MATHEAGGKIKFTMAGSSMNWPKTLDELTTNNGVYVLVPRELYNLMLKLLDAAAMKGATPQYKVEAPCWDPVQWGTESPLKAEGPLFLLYLHAYGPKKIQVIKTLRELYGLDLKESKELAETPDALVWTYTDQAEAMEALNALAAVKAYVSLYKTTGLETECVHAFVPDWVSVTQGIKLEHTVGDSSVIHHELPSPTSPPDAEGHPLP